MKLLPRLHFYFLKQFLVYFLIVTAGLSVFFALINLIDKLDSLMPYGPSFGSLVLFLLLTLPEYILYLLPMSVLLCIILTFTIASKRREVIAFKASGGNIMKLVVPFLIAGIIISMIDLGLSEYVVPLTNKSSNDLKYKIKEAKKRPALRQGDIWVRGKQGSILHAKTYIPEENVIKDVILFSSDGSRPTQMITADEAVWTGNAWSMRRAKSYDLINGKISVINHLDATGFTDPDVFAEGVLQPEEMGLVDVLRYRQRLAEAGYRNRKLDIEIMSRIIYPLTCLFMLMLGMAISLRKDLGMGIIGVAVGIIISLVYWFIHTFMLSLGFAGVLPPLLAAGFAPFAFGIASTLLLRKIPA